jgi:predicted helicase
MAPYAVAHFKLGMQLAGHDLTPAQREKWAYDFSGDERLGVFLTNTLEEAEQKAETLFGPLRVIAQEANAAAKIKRDLPILVVMGNPPYSGISANSGKWIESLMEDYKVTVREEERQIQRLSNDYVKFIRFAQWRLEQTGHGILAFITDSGYLDGILFRDMRKVLLDMYSEIFVLNLHGVAVRGPKNVQVGDQNVFDIQQGVAIAIFLKEEGKAGRAKVHYADIIGSREHKYRVLSETSIADTSWQELSTRPPSWYLVPAGSDIDYELWPSFTQIIGTGSPKQDRDTRYGTGVKTRHDEFVVGWSPQDAVRRVKQISDRSESAEQLIQELKLCTTAHFDIGRARERARDTDLLSYVRPIAYRPFDQRYIVYLREFVCEPKLETMRHLLHSDNIAIGVLRRDRKELGAGFFAAAGLIAKDMVSNLDDALIWPLYVYPNRVEKTQGQTELDVKTTLWPAGKDGRSPNLSPQFIADLEKRLGLKFVPEVPDVGAVREPPRAHRDAPLQFGPEDVFHYMYAVFHSPTYRTRYAEFLKSDFPRVPITSDLKLFRSLSGLGAELVALHLLESPKLAKPIARFPVKGSNLVDKGFPKYVAPGEPEPVFVEAASRRHTGGGVNPPLQSPLPRLKAGRVYINRSAEAVAAMSSSPSSAKSPVGTPPLQGGQYFEGVPPEVWNFHIGGYQVCEKWLKDRRGRTLTYDDLEHYCKVVTALSETIRLMAEIDEEIPTWPLT